MMRRVEDLLLARKKDPLSLDLVTLVLQFTFDTQQELLRRDPRWMKQAWVAVQPWDSLAKSVWQWCLRKTLVLEFAMKIGAPYREVLLPESQ